MPVWRMQCSFGADESLPRHELMINPHFNDSGVGTDPQGLCEDLAAALAAWATSAREVKVRAYDAQGTPPVFPQGEAIVNAGSAPASNGPREVAICLSYYGGQNVPRRRGRLYIPVVITGTSMGSARPGFAAREYVATLVPIFTGLGGADVDWALYSRTTDTAHSVTNWWIDDEWDTVRSRGLDPSTRIEGTTSEA